MWTIDPLGLPLNTFLNLGWLYLEAHLPEILGELHLSLDTFWCSPYIRQSTRLSSFQTHETRQSPFSGVLCNSYFTKCTDRNTNISREGQLLSLIFSVQERIFPKRALIVNWFFGGRRRAFIHLRSHSVCTTTKGVSRACVLVVVAEQAIVGRRLRTHLNIIRNYYIIWDGVKYLLEFYCRAVKSD